MFHKKVYNLKFSFDSSNLKSEIFFDFFFDSSNLKSDLVIGLRITLILFNALHLLNPCNSMLFNAIPISTPGK